MHSFAKRVLVVFALLTAQAMVAEVHHPGIDRGIQSNKVYDVLGLDTVNTYNGNLLIKLPLGLARANNGGMTWGLSLVYNGKNLDYRAEKWHGDPNTCLNPAFEYQYSVPTRHSNAGVGWNVSLGRLISVDNPVNDQYILDSTQAWSWQGCDSHFANERVRDLCSGEADWMYEAADGGEHNLNFDPVTGTGLSDDGSWLRSSYASREGSEPILPDYSYFKIEFPDGSVQKFQRFGPRGDWRLVRMKDVFGNTLIVSYAGAQADAEPFTKYTQMTITDSFGRNTVIDFAPATEYSSGTQFAEGYQRVVKSITTDALEFDGEHETNVLKRVVYTFRYEAQPLRQEGWVPPGTPAQYVLLLTGLETPNVDGNGITSAYRFVNELDFTTTPPTAAGRLTSMLLPTGGKIQWAYGLYVRSTANCTGYFASSSPGVIQRTLIDAGGNAAGTWTYHDRLNVDFTCEGCQNPDPFYHDNRDINGECSPQPKFFIYIKPRPEASVDVISPEGQHTVQYHNTLPSNAGCVIDGRQIDGAENGLPYTKRPIVAGHEYTRRINGVDYTFSEPKNPIMLDGAEAFLSTVVYTNCETDPQHRCQPEQAVYVRYADDGSSGNSGGAYLRNARVQAQRTVIFANHDLTTTAGSDYAPNDASQVVRTDYDGKGHYRVETATGNSNGLQPTRKTTIAYTPPDVTAATWFLPHYDSSTVEENGKKSVVLVCMGSDGFVSASRVVRSTDGVPAIGDVVTLFDKDDANGNLIAQHFGLATGPASGTTACGTSITDQYRVSYDYIKGVRISSTYANTRGDIPTFKFANLTIEPQTGLVVSSKDPAGVETKLFYDVLGRVRFEKRGILNNGPALGGESEYEYSNWLSTASPAKVVTSQRDRNGVELASGWVEFDSFGRTTREVRKMPEGNSVRETTYTAWGQKASVSEAGYGVPHSGKTLFAYDQLGRLTKVTSPDGSVTDIKHEGAGTTTTSSRIHRVAGDMTPTAKGTLTDVVAQNDPFGRLTQVKELSACSNGNCTAVTTTYGYDVGNRLASLSATDDHNVTQRRRFRYDAAGFLLHEEHPELTAAGVSSAESATEGITYGDYDSMGHAGTKITGSGAGAHSLEFKYDSAERLRVVKDGAHNTLEELVYDSPAGNSTCTTDCGRLLQATRHNRFVEADNSVTDATVTDRLTYDAAGRVSSKTTTIVSPAGSQSFAQSFSYNDLNLQSEIRYPTCSGCTGATPLTLPQHDTTLTYSNGLLTAVNGFASSITYHPSGIVHTVQHVDKDGAPSTLETIEADDNGLPRPKSIAFGGVNACSTITTQPQGGGIKAGQAHTLTVGTAAGSTGLKFEWFRGISGDESTPLTPSGGTNTLIVTPASTTNYWVKVSDSSGGCPTNSSTATVTVCQELAITDHAPLTQLVANNTPFTLFVAAAGTSIHYQWQKRNPTTGMYEDIGGATGTSYQTTIDALTKFKVIVTVTGACAGSAALEFTVDVGQCFTFDLDLPSAPVLAPGQSADMRVSVSSPSNTPITYEWHNRNGVIPGVNRPDLGASAPHDWDIIWVKVSNGCGTATSRHSHIRNATTCALPPLTLDQTEVDFMAENANFTFTASCDWVNLSWQWYHGESGDTHDPIDLPSAHTNSFTVQPMVGQYWVRVSTSCGAHQDSPTLNVYNGRDHCGPIHIIQQPDDVGNSAAGSSHTLTVDATSIEAPYLYDWVDMTSQQEAGIGKSLSVSPTVTTSYRATAMNTCGYIRSRIATVHVTSCAAITVNAQPQDYSINAGAPPVFLAIAASAGSQLTYQWYRGSSGDTTDHVDGATGPTLSVSPAQTTDYWVRVTAGSTCAIDSRTVRVWVCRPPVITKPPITQQASAGQMIWPAAEATGDDITYEWFVGEVGDTSAPAGQGWITSVVPFNTTKYWLKVTSACHGLPNASATAAFMVSVCPTAETPVPAKPLVMPGTSTTVSVTANGTYLTYKWYIGTSGDTSHPVSTNTNDGATIGTGNLSQPTHFWCAVTSGTCTVQSADVTVDVCNGVSVMWGGAATQVTQGYYQTVPVTYLPVADTQVTYYKGPAGDVAHSTVIGGPTMNAAVGITSDATATYWARATNGVCYADSAPLTITVCVPTITSQPADVLIDPNTSTDLTVTANGGALTYQWYVGLKGDTSQPVTTGGQAATLHVSPAATTKYWVRVTGSCSQSKDSNTVTVTLCAPASITSVPGPRTVNSGTQTTLTVVAAGTNLNYQWYQGAAGVTTTPVGTNSASLTIAPSVTTDYWVRVTAQCGSAANSTAVKVSVPPVITAQPVPVSITRGTTATFSISASGTQLSYQWYRGAASDTTNPISGATSASYTTPALTADTTYWVRAFSGNASTDSTAATAAICVSSGWTIASQATGQPSGGAVTLAAVSPNPNSSYAWYQGTSGNTGTPAGTGPTLVVYPTQTTSYWMRTTSATCYADSNTGTVVICTPSITAQPAPASVASGTPVTLTVAATGTPTLTYQWYTGASGTTTSPVTNATSASLTITASSTTSYWCRVTNGTGGCYANSNAATVTVCNTPAVTASPQLLTPNAGQSSQLSVTASGVSPTYQWYVGASGTTTTPFGTNAPTQLVGPQQTTDYWVKVTSSCGVVNSPSVKVSVTPIISVQPADVSITSGTSATFSVTASGAQLTYQWYRGAAGDTSNLIAGATSPSYTTPALTANATYWVLVKSGLASAPSTAATANICPAPIVNVSQGGGAISSAPVTLSIANPNGTDTYKWYRGNSGDTSNLLADTGTTPSYPVSPAQDTNYWARATGATCYANSATVTVTICTPKITQQPAGTGVVAPNSATLTVAATGNPTLTYQWYTGTSGTTTSPISGATSSSLTVAPGSTTSYWVKVTNGTGGSFCSVNSNTATVTVCNLPSITAHPVNQTLNGPTFSTTLAVTASGATSYQWFAGQPGDTSHPITNVVATASTTNVPFNDTTYVWVRASNACGSVNSNSALISVKPTIYDMAGNLHLTAGSIAKFVVSASGTSNHYSWWVNSVQQPNTDSPTFVTTLNADAWVAVYVTSGTAQNSAGTSATICDAVHVTWGPVKQTSGSCRSLSVGSDDPSATYQWYQGARGVTTTPLGTSNQIFVCPTTTTTYWCRITAGDGSGCYTDSAAITAP